MFVMNYLTIIINKNRITYRTRNIQNIKFYHISMKKHNGIHIEIFSAFEVISAIDYII